MDEKILRDLLVEGHTIAQLSKSIPLPEKDIISILEKYNVRQTDRGILKEVYKNVYEEDKEKFDEIIKKNIDNILNNGKQNIIVEYRILRDLLVEGHTIAQISKSIHLKEEDIISRFEGYNVRKTYRGILKEVYKKVYEDDKNKFDEIIDENIKDILTKGKQNIILDYRVLNLFLVHAYSKRGICRMIEEIPGDGWNGDFAQGIINRKYKLEEPNRGCLFLHTKGDIKKIIIKILKGKTVDKKEFEIKYDKFTKKYKGCYIKFDEEDGIECVHATLNGELRNLIKMVFNPLKKDIGICQYGNCNCKDNIQNAHGRKSRPDIFKECVNELNNNGIISVEELMKKFLGKHINHKYSRTKVPPILYLCNKHHLEYDKLLNDSKRVNDYKTFVENLLI